MAYTIREYRDGDATALARLLAEAIAVIGPRRYSEAQVAAWGARHPGPDRLKQRVDDGAMIFVAADSHDVPVAYAMLEPDGHLDHLYCHPDHTRRGLAFEVLMAAESKARQLGVERLFTEASELACAAFEWAGYEVTHRRDFEIDHDGKAVPIHNYAMERRLD